MINGFVFYPLTYSNIFQMFPLFQQLPLEILDFVLSFLKHEDILMLQDCLPRVQHCPRYKRLVNQSELLNQMWHKISDYGELHEHCKHICLPEVTMNPFNVHDEYLEHEDSFSCYFQGKGIFCYPMNELRGEVMSQFEKQIVPLKKHIHCNCDMNKLIACDVHDEDDDEKYEEETISFAKRMGNGGYDEIQSTTQTNKQLSNVQTSQVNMLTELTDEEMEQLFEEF